MGLCVFAGSSGDVDVPMSIVDLIKRYSARQCNNKNIQYTLSIHPYGSSAHFVIRRIKAMIIKESRMNSKQQQREEKNNTTTEKKKRFKTTTLYTHKSKRYIPIYKPYKRLVKHFFEWDILFLKLHTETAETATDIDIYHACDAETINNNNGMNVAYCKFSFIDYHDDD